LAVFPSNSGIAISGAVVGYITGIYDRQTSHHITSLGQQDHQWLLNNEILHTETMQYKVTVTCTSNIES